MPRPGRLAVSLRTGPSRLRLEGIRYFRIDCICRALYQPSIHLMMAGRTCRPAAERSPRAPSNQWLRHPTVPCGAGALVHAFRHTAADGGSTPAPPSPKSKRSSGTHPRPLRGYTPRPGPPYSPNQRPTLRTLSERPAQSSITRTSIILTRREARRHRGSKRSSIAGRRQPFSPFAAGAGPVNPLRSGIRGPSGPWEWSP